MKLSALPILAALAVLAACTTTARERPPAAAGNLDGDAHHGHPDPLVRPVRRPRPDHAGRGARGQLYRRAVRPGGAAAGQSRFLVPGGAAGRDDGDALAAAHRRRQRPAHLQLPHRHGRQHLPGAAARALENSDIVFVGYGINAPERNWNDYAGVDVRGKTVVILVNDPDWQTQGLEGTFNGRAMTYYGRWTYKYEEAARQGAAAAFIVHDTAPASYGWNVVQSSWTGAQYNMDDPGNHMDQSAVIGWLTLDAATRLFANSGLDLAALRERRHGPPAPCRCAAARRSRSPTRSGRIAQRRRHPARTDAAQRICHLHRALGPSRPLRRRFHRRRHLQRRRRQCERHRRSDLARRGACARRAGGADPRLPRRHRRGSGLLGSKYYGEHPIFPLAQTAGGINMDSLSLNGDARDMVSIGGGKSALDAYLRAPRRPTGWCCARSPRRRLATAPTISAWRGSACRCSIPSSARTWSTAGPPPAAPRRQDYRANRYHQPSDEYNPTWNWTGAIHELQIFYVIARQLADSGDWPNWNEGDEFRAIRDRRGRGSDRPPAARMGAARIRSMGFPSHAELWEDDLEPAREEVAAFAAAVHAGGKGEEVRLVAADPNGRGGAAAGPFATIVEQAFGDIWLRDTGPLILMEDRSVARSFHFNGWGGKYRLQGDDTLAPRLAGTIGLAAEPRDWVFEGGAIDVDGTGLAVTTEQCLLNPNRNLGMDRTEVAARLRGRSRHRTPALARRRPARRPYRRPCRQSRPLRRRGGWRSPCPKACRIPNVEIWNDARYRAESFGLEVSRCRRRVASTRAAKSSPPPT